MSAKTKTTATTSNKGTVAKRKVTIYSTQAKSSQVIETSATTWGELKAEIPNVGNVRAVVRETRNAMDSTTSQLPDQDFTLFMYPQKVRSGDEETLVVKKKEQ